MQFPAPLVAGRFLPDGADRPAHDPRRDARDLVELERLQCDAVHFDAYVEGQLGGTGDVAPWDLIEAHRPVVPFVLSGGLQPDNVAEAVTPSASGRCRRVVGCRVEPGIKDADAMRAFIEAARS